MRKPIILVQNRRAPAKGWAILGRVNFVHLLLPDFGLILCGYLVCRYTALNRTVWEAVENLVYFFLIQRPHF